MKNIGLFFVLIVLVAVGCKSKKTGSTKPQAVTQKQTQTKQLSQKLSLEVNESDDIKLYGFVAEWLGTQHALGKCTKSGIDCSCFIKLLYEQVYQKNIPRTAAEMHKAAKRVEKKALTEGDLVFFNIKSTKASHVGVYLKDGWFAHVSTSKGVMINNLSEKYYVSCYLSGGKI